MVVRLHRLTRRRRAARAADGYTLIEVAVAMLITAFLVTSVFSIALTGKSSGAINDRKLLAAAGVRQVSAKLRNYVTADSIDSAINLPGPGNGANSWSMTSDGVTDSCGNCYALASGPHELTGVLPAWFEAAPYNARVSYTVDNSEVVTISLVPLRTAPVPAVVITATWIDP